VISRIKRLLKLAAALVAFLVYVWFAAVRSLPYVKRRKALRRQARRAVSP
jgi:hypothetical protein